MAEVERSEDLTGAVERKEEATDAAGRTEVSNGPVELTVPARSEHLRVLRLVAASVAASLELDVDQLDDLRIAIDELCGGLIEHAVQGARLRLRLVGRSQCLEAEGSIVEGGSGGKVDPISQLILDGLDVDWSNDEQVSCFQLVAPRQGAP